MGVIVISVFVSLNVLLQPVYAQTILGHNSLLFSNSTLIEDAMHVESDYDSIPLAIDYTDIPAWIVATGSVSTGQYGTMNFSVYASSTSTSTGDKDFYAGPWVGSSDDLTARYQKYAGLSGMSTVVYNNIINYIPSGSGVFNHDGSSALSVTAVGSGSGTAGEFMFNAYDENGDLLSQNLDSSYGIPLMTKFEISQNAYDNFLVIHVDDENLSSGEPGTVFAAYKNIDTSLDYANPTYIGLQMDGGDLYAHSLFVDSDSKPRVVFADEVALVDNGVSNCADNSDDDDVDLCVAGDMKVNNGVVMGAVGGLDVYSQKETVKYLCAYVEQGTDYLKTDTSATVGYVVSSNAAEADCYDFVFSGSDTSGTYSSTGDYVFSNLDLNSYADDASDANSDCSGGSSSYNYCHDYYFSSTSATSPSSPARTDEYQYPNTAGSDISNAGTIYPIKVPTTLGITTGTTTINSLYSSKYNYVDDSNISDYSIQINLLSETIMDIYTSMDRADDGFYDMDEEKNDVVVMVSMVIDASNQSLYPNGQDFDDSLCLKTVFGSTEQKTFTTSSDSSAAACFDFEAGEEDIHTFRNVFAVAYDDYGSDLYLTAFIYAVAESEGGGTSTFPTFLAFKDISVTFLNLPNQNDDDNYIIDTSDDTPIVNFGTNYYDEGSTASDSDYYTDF